MPIELVNEYAFWVNAQVPVHETIDYLLEKFGTAFKLVTSACWGSLILRSVNPNTNIPKSDSTGDLCKNFWEPSSHIKKFNSWSLDFEKYGLDDLETQLYSSLDDFMFSITPASASISSKEMDYIPFLQNFPNILRIEINDSNSSSRAIYKPNAIDNAARSDFHWQLIEYTFIRQGLELRRIKTDESQQKRSKINELKKLEIPRNRYRGSVDDLLGSIIKVIETNPNLFEIKAKISTQEATENLRKELENNNDIIDRSFLDLSLVDAGSSEGSYILHSALLKKRSETKIVEDTYFALVKQEENWRKFDGIQISTISSTDAIELILHRDPSVSLCYLTLVRVGIKSYNPFNEIESEILQNDEKAMGQFNGIIPKEKEIETFKQPVTITYNRRALSNFRSLGVEGQMGNVVYTNSSPQKFSDLLDDPIEDSVSTISFYSNKSQNEFTQNGKSIKKLCRKKRKEIFDDEKKSGKTKKVRQLKLRNGDFFGNSDAPKKLKMEQNEVVDLIKSSKRKKIFQNRGVIFSSEDEFEINGLKTQHIREVSAGSHKTIHDIYEAENNSAACLVEIPEPLNLKREQDTKNFFVSSSASLFPLSPSLKCKSEIQHGKNNDIARVFPYFNFKSPGIFNSHQFPKILRTEKPTPENLQFSTLNCVVCDKPRGGNRNVIKKCSECHLLFHEKCHQPHIFSYELKLDEWMCKTCRDT
ncbi:Integrator complex subunit 12, partial [Nowakowskiella sp. JEL0078]